MLLHPTIDENLCLLEKLKPGFELKRVVIRLPVFSEVG